MNSQIARPPFMAGTAKLDEEISSELKQGMNRSRLLFKAGIGSLVLAILWVGIAAWCWYLAKNSVPLESLSQADVPKKVGEYFSEQGTDFIRLAFLDVSGILKMLSRLMLVVGIIGALWNALLMKVNPLFITMVFMGAAIIPVGSIVFGENGSDGKSSYEERITSMIHSGDTESISGIKSDSEEGKLYLEYFGIQAKFNKVNLKSGENLSKEDVKDLNAKLQKIESKTKELILSPKHLAFLDKVVNGKYSSENSIMTIQNLKNEMVKWNELSLFSVALACIFGMVSITGLKFASSIRNRMKKIHALVYGVSV